MDDNKVREFCSIFSFLSFSLSSLLFLCYIGAFIGVLPSMAENTRLRKLHQQLQTLQLQVQNQDDASLQRFTEFKRDILAMFDDFQTRLLLQIPTTASSSTPHHLINLGYLVLPLLWLWRPLLPPLMSPVLEPLSLIFHVSHLEIQQIGFIKSSVIAVTHKSLTVIVLFSFPCI